MLGTEDGKHRIVVVLVLAAGVVLILVFVGAIVAMCRVEVAVGGAGALHKGRRVG